MKYIIIFVFLFVSCKSKDCIKSTSYDKRCLKLETEAGDYGRKIGVCYKPKEDELVFAKDRPRLDPDHEACNDLYIKAREKCKALPPPGPDDIVYSSGSFFGRKSDCD